MKQPNCIKKKSCLKRKQLCDVKYLEVADAKAESVKDNCLRRHRSVTPTDIVHH